MMKKISAVLLALVLCLSVVVIPASAAGFDSDYEFESGKSVAFKIEFDKENYSKGEEVTVNLYMKLADEAAEIKSAYLTFGLDADVFDLTSLPYKSAVACDAWEEYWESPNSSALWATVSNATILGKLNANLTSEEATFMDTYLRTTVGQDTEKVTDTTHGVAASDINDSVPFLSFKLKLKDDIADGTAIKIAMPQASFTQTPAQTTVTYFTKPGTATTGKAYAAATYDAGNIATATVGSAVAPSILQYSKAQIRFKGITATSGASTYEGTFDVRTVAKISEADFLSTFESEAHAMTPGVVTDLGFVYAATSNVAVFDLDTAKAVAEGGSAAGYVKKSVTYMQHNDGTDYTFTCLIADIADADKTDGVSCIAYVCYEGNYIYFDAAATVSYADLYQRMPA